MTNEMRTRLIRSSAHVKGGYNTWYSGGNMTVFTLNFTTGTDAEQTAKYTSTGAYISGLGRFMNDPTPGYEDLAFSGSHTQGVNIWSVADDGSVTRLFHSGTKPNDASTSYWSTVAIDRQRHHMYTSTYNSNGIVRYDYSSRDEATILASRRILGEADGLHDERSSTYYRANGMYVLGDYLYQGSLADFTNVPRWNIETEVGEYVPCLNATSASHWQLFYDNPRDRLYMMSQSSGEMKVVVDASTVGATAFMIDTSYASLGTTLSSGILAVDKDNPSILYVGGDELFMSIDITDVLAGTTDNPTALQPLLRTHGNYARTNQGLLTASSYGSPPEGSLTTDQLIFVTGYSQPRGGLGWYDKENRVMVLPVGGGRGDFTTTTGANTGEAGFLDDNDIYAPDGRIPVASEWQYVPVKVTSPNGTTYWVTGGSGGRAGSNLSVFSGDDWRLEAEGEIIFGDYALTSGGTITDVQILHNNDELFVPSGCTLNIDLSTDSGTTWEPYSGWESSPIVRLVNQGTVLQVRYRMTGTGTEAPHYTGQDPVAVNLMHLDESGTYRAPNNRPAIIKGGV